MSISLAIIWKPANNPDVMLAYVGDIKVALVQYPVPGNFMQEFYVAVYLPDCDKSEEVWRKTEAGAKKYVVNQVGAWFKRTGLMEER